MTTLPTVVPSGVPSQHEMDVYRTMADTAVTSKMYRGIGDQSGVMMIMLAAREMGLPPMAALNGGINIINGKVEISARMMSGMIRRSGHSLKIIENTDTSCTIKGIRADNGDSLTCTFTINDAQRAGLVKPGGGWTKWPKDMLFARTLSRLARQLFSDVIGMGYVEGEISSSTLQPACVEEIEEVPPEEEYTLSDIHSLVGEEDKEGITTFLEQIMKHYEISQNEAIKQMLKDTTHTTTRFQEWKMKNAQKHV